MVRAGEEGWSVIVTLVALDSALIMDGRAVPIDIKDRGQQISQVASHRTLA